MDNDATASANTMRPSPPPQSLLWKKRLALGAGLLALAGLLFYGGLRWRRVRAARQWPILYQQGRGLNRIEDFQEAEPVFRSALDTAQIVGPNTSWVNLSRAQLAFVLGREGHFTEALALRRQCLAGAEAAYGPESVSAGQAWMSMGYAELNMENFAGAERDFRRALQILHRGASATDHGFCECWRGFASIRTATGDFRNADQCVRQALAMSRDDFQRAACDANLADNDAQVGAFQEADMMAQWSLSTRRTSAPPSHREIGASYLEMGSLSMAEGRCPDALAWYGKAKSEWSQAQGLPSYFVGELWMNTAFADLALGRLKEADALLQKAQPLLGVPEPLAGHTAAFQRTQGCLLYLQGRYQEAETLARQALQGDETIYGHFAPATLLDANNLGVILLAEGRTQRAIALFQQVLLARKKAQGLHPASAAALHNLAAAYQTAGNTKEAAYLWSEERMVWTRVHAREPKVRPSLWWGLVAGETGVPINAAKY